MTIKEILKRRFIALITDLFVQWRYGHIFNTESEMTQKLFEIEGEKPPEHAICRPGAFRELDWWELRDIADMPEYVICFSETTHWTRASKYGSMLKKIERSEHPVYKVEKCLTTGVEVIYYASHRKILSYSMYKLFPATKEQYDNYQK